MKQTKIENLNFSDVTRLQTGMKYFDGEVAFADQVSSIPNLKEQFKVNFVAFLFCIKGNLELRLNDTDYHVHEHDAIFINMNTVVNSIKHDNDFKCVIIAVSTEFGITFINKTIFDAIMQIQANPIMKFTQDEVDLMVRYYELGIFKMEHPSVNYGNETMINILRSYALDLLSSVSKHITESANSMLRQGDKLFHRFIILLASNENNERSVKYFAQRLCVSPKYLTSICNQKCGKTASELIASSITGRIKQLLRYSDKTIKEVAAEMNFENLSFFGKYVKKHLGVSPNNFRKHVAYGQ